MDKDMVRALEGQVVSELSGFCIRCSDEQAALLVRHLDLVIEKNKVVNLTRILDPVEAVTLHIVDSLLPLACPGLDMGSEDGFVDVGTGAGFPGIPLGILTGARGTLVDSVGKKVTAVNEFIDELGLERLVAVHSRVEELDSAERSSRQFVFARAVAQSNVLVEYAAPLLAMGGCAVLEKARPDDEELACADRAAEICGMRLVSRETFELPRGLGHREILIYKKVSKPRIKLPRRTGLAKHEPLGL